MKFEYKVLRNPSEAEINMWAALGYKVIAVVSAARITEVYMERVIPAEVVEEERFELVTHDEPHR